MKHRKLFLFLLAGVLLLLFSGCSTLNSDSRKKAKKKTSKKQTETSWIREQFHHEQISEGDINRRTLENFEVFPGRKGFRSKTLESREPISIW